MKKKPKNIRKTSKNPKHIQTKIHKMKFHKNLKV